MFFICAVTIGMLFRLESEESRFLLVDDCGFATKRVTAATISKATAMMNDFFILRDVILYQYTSRQVKESVAHGIIKVPKR